jgi:hypothetical protein
MMLNVVEMVVRFLSFKNGADSSSPVYGPHSIQPPITNQQIHATKNLEFLRLATRLWLLLPALPVLTCGQAKVADRIAKCQCLGAAEWR